MAEDDQRQQLVGFATELTKAWLTNANTRVGIEQVPDVLRSMHEALSRLVVGSSEQQARVPEAHVPAVSVRKSLSDPNRIVSMIDGKSYASLRRHLNAHGLTPEAYRSRYGLKPDYPMVAPGYSAARSEKAKSIGLGRKLPNDQATAAPAPSAKRARTAKRSVSVQGE
ncbi:MucR family transcriptional regulator [Sphingomonas sp. BK580]|uniref:MucR family transcriptional regulator n=1 Tax=Sphingomonas sp. BK580 TaxID=2586972 RepID=UPI00160BB357|nr:MucR family transcriptional regulator [Sphingomonas sp. BK580]MBB3695270.1 putative transcriptional regulator [Sphingomonas sp. BK580]